MGVIFPFFQSSGTSPDCHDISNMMDNDLATSFTSSFRTQSGTKPLTFTFVPSIGRLPTHCEVVDVSKFLVTIPEEPNDLSDQEIINKSNAVSDELALKSGARQDCVLAVHTDSIRTVFQSPVCNSSKGEMQENDLFKAEFILITDSGEEDEVAAASNNAHRPSNGYGPISAQLLATSHASPGTGAGKPPGDGHVPGAALSHNTADLQKHQQYKIKTSYKAFAAIPTNTLLMEQKALEEPIKTTSVTEGTALDTHSEMCSPAELRQQTEQLCAVIDQVLQDPLTMVTHQYGGLTFFLPFLFSHVSTTLQRAAGRETRYSVNCILFYFSSISFFLAVLWVKTKPGVIRPVLVKGKSAEQKEEPYQPNPFKKYLEEISDQNTEQIALLHPLYPTKLIPPTESSACPPSVSLAVCLNPGPFSHLSSIMCDVHENPYSPYSHNYLYNKVSMKCRAIQELFQAFIL
uniref:Muscular LMNA interacting protein n=1 Tax=Strigops habroptila TaxID=2489341 RepID=A0A672VDJ4_STRHB